MAMRTHTLDIDPPLPRARCPRVLAVLRREPASLDKLAAATGLQPASLLRAAAVLVDLRLARLVRAGLALECRR